MTEFKEDFTHKVSIIDGFSSQNCLIDLDPSVSYYSNWKFCFLFYGAVVDGTFLTGCG